MRPPPGPGRKANSIRGPFPSGRGAEPYGSAKVSEPSGPALNLSRAAARFASRMLMRCCAHFGRRSNRWESVLMGDLLDPMSSYGDDYTTSSLRSLGHLENDPRGPEQRRHEHGERDAREQGSDGSEQLGPGVVEPHVAPCLVYVGTGLDDHQA